MEPYNPLDKRHLGESIVAALLARPRVELPPPRFSGTGVYSIYYAGDHPAYEPLRGRDWPIYVGRAEPEGSRRGVLGAEARASEKLWQRLGQHARSVEQARDLEPTDFTCRFLLVDDVWIPLGESLLIQKFLPVWNLVVDGFGIHDPGGGRRIQRRSAWDELHPGRHWATKQGSAHETREQTLERIAQHFRDYPPGDVTLVTP